MQINNLLLIRIEDLDNAFSKNKEDEEDLIGAESQSSLENERSRTLKTKKKKHFKKRDKVSLDLL